MKITELQVGMFITFNLPFLIKKDDNKTYLQI